VRQGFPTNIYTDTAGTSYVSEPVSGSYPYASRLPASLGVLSGSIRGFQALSVSPLNKPLLFPYLASSDPLLARHRFAGRDASLGGESRVSVSPTTL
jgi:hypothetical protein